MIRRPFSPGAVLARRRRSRAITPHVGAFSTGFSPPGWLPSWPNIRWGRVRRPLRCWPMPPARSADHRTSGRIGRTHSALGAGPNAVGPGEDPGSGSRGWRILHAATSTRATAPRRVSPPNTAAPPPLRTRAGTGSSSAIRCWSRSPPPRCTSSTARSPSPSGKGPPRGWQCLRVLNRRAGWLAPTNGLPCSRTCIGAADTTMRPGAIETSR